MGYKNIKTSNETQKKKLLQNKNISKKFWSGPGGAL